MLVYFTVISAIIGSDPQNREIGQRERFNLLQNKKG